MNMNMNMGMGSPASGMEKPKNEFRGLVEGLLKGSDIFPVISVGDKGEKMSVIDALEKNELSLYVDYSGNSSDKKLDAVHCLVAIYDELKKPDPDHEFVEQTIEQLKEYL